jgi:hypothetical protein
MDITTGDHQVGPGIMTSKDTRCDQTCVKMQCEASKDGAAAMKRRTTVVVIVMVV